MMGLLGVGDQAPDFTLPRSKDERWTLSEVLKTKNAVLVFYLLDFSAP
jgi:peroxiredoxin